MAHVLLRRQAIELRKAGKSYNQIRDELKVSKSTLSDWLKNLPLTEEQREALKDNISLRIERYRMTMQMKRKAKLLSYYKELKGAFSSLNKREIYLAGLFLYWGEGAKTTYHQVDISNTDPSVLKFVLLWMRIALEIPKAKIKAHLHLYKDMDINEVIDFWSKELHISKTQFVKPYIKTSNKSDLDQKGFGHGTCHLVASNTIIKKKILMGIKVMGDYAAEYIPNL